MIKTDVEFATESEIKEQLLKFDFEFWFKRALIVPSRKRIETILKKRISRDTFKDARECCKWWRNPDRPRRHPSAVTTLDADGWQRLRQAVQNHMVELQGRTLDEAVAIVSTSCPCNSRVLSGLNSDLRVWKQ